MLLLDHGRKPDQLPTVPWTLDFWVNQKVSIELSMPKRILDMCPMYRRTLQEDLWEDMYYEKCMHILQAFRPKSSDLLISQALENALRMPMKET